jgi:hypothetical protein
MLFCPFQTKNCSLFHLFLIFVCLISAFGKTVKWRFTTTTKRARITTKRARITTKQTTSTTKRARITTKPTTTTTKPTTTTTKRTRKTIRRITTTTEQTRPDSCPPGFVGENCDIECGVTYFEQNVGELRIISDDPEFGIVNGVEAQPNRFYFVFILKKFLPLVI